MGKKRSNKQEAKNALLAALAEAKMKTKDGLIEVQVELELEDGHEEGLLFVTFPFKVKRKNVLPLFS